MVGCVDFNDNKDMFNELYEEYINEEKGKSKVSYI